jgi:RNA polymerase sigma-70 factor (ECF subfamily)
MDDTKQTFLRAFEEQSDALFRHAFFKIGDREMAKDILQDTFMKTWDYIMSGKEIANMRAFLYKTMGNLVIDLYRKKKTYSLDALNEAGFEPGGDDLPEEEKFDGKIALSLLKNLPSSYQEVIFLRYVNGLNISEIAIITEDSENNISVKIHRGLKKLKELFESR